MSAPPPPPSDEERRQEVTRLVEHLDAALGRPPFANPCSANTLEAAVALRCYITRLQAAGKIAVLQKEHAVITTLPVLCASLPEGSANKRPCLRLYRELLLSVAPVCLISTFPPPTILNAAEQLLPHDDVVLFQITAAARGLTAPRLRRFLGLADTTAPHQSTKKNKKGGTAPGTRTAVSPQLLDKILETSLEPQLVPLFLGLFQTPDGFATHIGSDSALAARLLNVYGALLLPVLGSATLVPCLDVETLPYVVDVVAREGQACAAAALPSPPLHSATLVDRAMETWTPERIESLTAHITTARRSAADGEPIAVLTVYAFVLRVAWQRGVEPPSLRGLCLAVLEAATWSLLSLAGQPGPTAFLTATGDLAMTPDSVARVLEPLAVIADMADAACVADSASARTGSPCFVPACWNEASSSSVPAATAAALRGAARTLSTHLRACVEEVTKKKPAGTPKTPSAATSSKQGKGTKSSKNNKKDQPKASTGAAAPPESTAAPVLLCDALIQLSRIQFALGAMADADSTKANLRTLFSGLAYLEKHQRRCPSCAAYSALLDLCALSGWQQSAVAVTPSTDPSASADAATAVGEYCERLAEAVRLTSRCTWVASFFRTPSSGRAFVQTSASVPLTAALLAAATVHRADSPADGALTVQRETVLAPLSVSAVTGLLGFHLSDAQLRDVADAMGRREVPLAAYVQRQLERFVREDEEEARGFLFASAGAEACYADCFSADLGSQVIGGLQRLREALAAALHAQQATAQEGAQARAEAEKRIAQQKIAEAARLASVQASFDAAREARLTATREAQAHIRETVAARQQRHAEQLIAEKAARARKREQARETMQEMAQTSAKARNEQRQARVSVYKRRQMQAFRVGSFLEQIGLSTARVIEVQRVVQSILDTVTPDDLLEYLVTGKPQVPRDMVDDPEAGEAAVVVPSAAAPTSVVGFWDSVMQSTDGSAGSDPAPGMPSVRDRSFHLRVAPFLDLFCYDGGDEFGTVPSPLPQLKVSLARRVVPLADVKEMGFDSLDAVFHRLADRGVVTLQSGIAQLTLIGFRYHFPFHNEERMLEIRVHQNRERVRAVLLAQRGTTFASAVTADDDAACWDDNDGRELGTITDEEEEEEEEDEEDEQVLPDDDFGI